MAGDQLDLAEISLEELDAIGKFDKSKFFGSWTRVYSFSLQSRVRNFRPRNFP